MQNHRSELEVHVFVCTNKKANGACCADRGGQELRVQLKNWTSTFPQWKNRIRINQSGCLDRCENGVAIAIYPQNQWITDVVPADLPSIQKQISALMK